MIFLSLHLSLSLSLFGVMSPDHSDVVVYIWLLELVISPFVDVGNVSNSSLVE